MNDLETAFDAHFERQLTDVFESHENGDYPKAETLYRELIDQYPTIWQLYFNCGLLFYEQHRYEEALNFYLAGLAINDSSEDLLYNTGICQKELGRFEDAIASYTKALELAPGDIDCRYNMASCCRAVGKEHKAARIYAEIIETEPAHLPSLNNLAYLSHKYGDNQRALDLYRRILIIDPDHVCADHMLAALSGESRSNAPNNYIRDVFNQFADHYETCLTEQLQYSLPARLVDFCAASLQKKVFPRMLDLGCGTGLAGEQFAPICRSMTGVDLSKKMIEAAAIKNLYESLFVAEILSFLKQSRTNSYDLILSADVLPYVGDLEQLFEAAGNRVAFSGSFLFSVEHLDSRYNRPQLQASGRFAHSRSYIANTALKTGWRIIAEEIIDLRRERGRWIRGCIYGMVRK